MGLFAVNDVIECVIRGKTATSTIINTFHYRAVTIATPDIAALNTSAASFKTFMSSTLLDCLDVSYKAVEARINVLTGARAGEFGISAFTAGEAGVMTSEGGRLPEIVAVSIKRHAALRGRKYQSRIFVSPLATTVRDDAGLGSDFVQVSLAAFVSLAAKQLITLTNDIGTFNPCIFHRSTRTFDDITSSSVGQRFVRRYSRSPREPV